MNNIVLMSLSLLLILCTTSQCICQEIGNLTVIYAVGRDVFARESGGSKASRKLTTFAGDVTSIVKYENYLFISEKSSGFLWSKEHSAIWRVGITDSKSFAIDYDSWKKFHELSVVNEDILSMVIANGYIYIGRTDGIMWLCSASVSNRCKNFNYFEAPITAIDYNPLDGQVYAIENGPLNFNVSNVLKRCLPDTSNSCKQTIFFDTNDGVTALKAAFRNIWLSTKKSILWKCPFEYKTRNFTTVYKNCQNFDEFDTSRPRYYDFTNKYLYATSKYLYAYLKNDEYIWRCDPEKVWSCSRLFQAFPGCDISTFIVIENE